MNFNEMKQKLYYFGEAMIGFEYIADYIDGITENDRPKIEFIYNNSDCIVLYIPTKGYKCYVDNKDVGIFKNYLDFVKYVDNHVKNMTKSKYKNKYCINILSAEYKLDDTINFKGYYLNADKIADCFTLNKSEAMIFYSINEAEEYCNFIINDLWRKEFKVEYNIEKID